MNTSMVVVAFLMLGLLVAPSRAWMEWLSESSEGQDRHTERSEDQDWHTERSVDWRWPSWPWLDRAREAYQGAGDMFRAYNDMRKANWQNSDKYFHARGNYDAAQRGPGGAWAAGVISDARETWQGGVSGRGAEDTRADQEANQWGRDGNDPNHYRPEGLPDEY